MRVLADIDRGGRMRMRTGLLLALPLVLAACGGDGGEDSAAVDEAMEAIDEVMPPMPTTATLTPLGDSGVNGEAVLMPMGAESEVTVSLAGLAPGTSHPGHIHEGTCAAPGPVILPLSEITADGNGAGSMSVVAPIAADSALAGEHIILYHGEGGTPIVCAELAAHTM